MRRIFFFAAAFCAFLLWRTPPVFAAEVFVEAASGILRVGEPRAFTVFLASPGERVNAVEGRVEIPPGLFEIEELHDGDSAVSFWVERPRAEAGGISFAGIMPGGFQSEKGALFSFALRAASEGRGEIAVPVARVLLDDGRGTPAALSARGLALEVSGRNDAPELLPEPQDVDPPETFEPTVARDPSVFDGRFFLVFATQDKGAGIDRYEVREGRGAYMTVESPYLLGDQELGSDIFVKAIDRSGNERVAKIAARKRAEWWQPEAGLLLGAAALLVVFAVAVLRTRSARKTAS